MIRTLAPFSTFIVLFCSCARPADHSGTEEVHVAPAIASTASEARPPIDTAHAAAQFPSANEHANAVLTSTIIDAPNGTFGYDIFGNGKLFLHQTSLPGQPGNDGCKTKADAEKLAALVIGKIKKGEMPPTVTTEELETLGLKP